jgi:hypothetical protein
LIINIHSICVRFEKEIVTKLISIMPTYDDDSATPEEEELLSELQTNAILARRLALVNQVNSLETSNRFSSAFS